MKDTRETDKGINQEFLKCTEEGARGFRGWEGKYKRKPGS